MSAVKCEHIKENGERCRGYAIWGLEPPRCASHRLDGAATNFGGNRRLISKYYGGGDKRLTPLKREAPKTRLAKLFAQFHYLGKGMKAAQEDENYKKLLRLIQRKTEVTMRIVAEVEEFGETLADEALDLAEVMVRTIEAERREIERKLREERMGSLKRSPGYWAVYRFLREYMETYHICPKYREIVNGTGLGRGSVYYYVKLLERDGFVERIPGERRNIRLIE